jgi:hypothetical protein
MCVVDVGMKNNTDLSLWKWLKLLITGKPHFTIGGAARPYMHRRYLVPRNQICSIYLHQFLRDDDDRALHDHPWWFVSLILKGGYCEVTEGGIKIRNCFSVAFRPALHRHRVVLWRTPKSNEAIPCWTLVITGPKKRTWGFWCPKGFVPWREFVNQEDTGQVGRGCE